MEGSRLLIHSPNPKIGADWVRTLNRRMRARKLFDRYPGTKIVAMPIGEMHDLPSHLDRLHLRDILSRGSVIRDLDYSPLQLFGIHRNDPDCLIMDARKCDFACDEILDEWLEYQKRAEQMKWRGGHGAPYPKVIFVEDLAQNPERNKSTSAKTFTEILNHARLWEYDIHFIGCANLQFADLSFIRAQEIVAVGVNAGIALENIGVTAYERFPHPEYILGKRRSLKMWGETLRKHLSHVVFDL